MAAVYGQPYAGGVTRTGLATGFGPNKQPHNYGLDSGPMRDPTTRAPGGSEQNPWEIYFGLPEAPIHRSPYEQHDTETINFPQAYKGENLYLSTVFCTIIASAQQYPIRVMLPWSDAFPGIDIVWDEMIFNDHVLHISPEQSTPRLVSTKMTTNRAKMLRHGLGALLEHGTLGTPMGDLLFRNNILQIANACVVTMCIGAVMACLNPAYHNLPSVHKTPSISTRSLLEQRFMRFTREWACFHKDPGSARQMMNNNKTLMEIRTGAPGNIYVAPSGTLDMIENRPEYQVHPMQDTMGPDFHKKFLELKGGFRFYESRAWPMGDGQPPSDPQYSPRRISSFCQMNSFYSEHLTSDKYRTACMDIVVYSEKLDNWIRLKSVDAQKYTGLFARVPDDYSSDLSPEKVKLWHAKKKQGRATGGYPGALTRIGVEFFSSFPTWGDWMAEAKMLQRTLDFLTDEKRPDRFTKFIQTFGQQVTADDTELKGNEFKKSWLMSAPPSSPAPPPSSRAPPPPSAPRVLARPRWKDSLQYLLGLVSGSISTETQAVAAWVLMCLSPQLPPTTTLVEQHIERLQGLLETMDRDEKKANASGGVFQRDKNLESVIPTVLPEALISRLAQGQPFPNIFPSTSQILYITREFVAHRAVPFSSRQPGYVVAMDDELGRHIGDRWSRRTSLADYTQREKTELQRLFGQEWSPEGLLMYQWANEGLARTPVPPEYKEPPGVAEFPENSISTMWNMRPLAFKQDLTAHVAGRLRVLEDQAEAEAHNTQDDDASNAPYYGRDHQEVERANQDTFAKFPALMRRYKEEVVALFIKRVLRERSWTIHDFGVLMLLVEAGLRSLEEKNRHSLLVINAGVVLLLCALYTEENKNPRIRSSIRSKADAIVNATTFSEARNRATALGDQMADTMLHVFYMVRILRQEMREHSTEAGVVNALKNHEVWSITWKRFLTGPLDRNTSRASAMSIYYNLPIDYQLVAFHNENDLPPLINILLVRQPAYEMGTGIYMRGYGDAGLTFQGQSNVMMGPGISRKTFLIHYTTYAKSVIFDPLCIHHNMNVACREYLGGNGHSFWDPLNPDHVEQYRRGDLSYDFLAIPLGPGEMVNSQYFDLSGKLDASLGMDDSEDAPLDYSSARLYSGVWGWNRVPGAASGGADDVPAYFNLPYDPDPSHDANTLSFRDHMFVCGGGNAGGENGDLGRVIIACGHWGPDIYPGVGQTRSQFGKRYIVPQNYGNWNLSNSK